MNGKIILCLLVCLTIFQSNNGTFTNEEKRVKASEIKVKDLDDQLNRETTRARVENLKDSSFIFGSKQQDHLSRKQSFQNDQPRPNDMLNDSLFSLIGAITKLNGTTIPCNKSTIFSLKNGTCLSMISILNQTLAELRDNSTRLFDSVSMLNYYSDLINRTDIVSYPTVKLILNEIKRIMNELNNLNSSMKTIDSIDTIPRSMRKRQQQAFTGVLYFGKHRSQIFHDVDIDTVYNSNASFAIYFDGNQLTNIDPTNFVVVDRRILQVRAQYPSDTYVISPEVFLNFEKNFSSKHQNIMSLYFQTSNENRTNDNKIYACAFYDEKISSWNKTSCSKARFNSKFVRHECNCSLQSRFALVLIPRAYCDNETHTMLTNDSCVFKEIAQANAVGTLRNGTINGNSIANALSLYVSSISNSSKPLNSSITLTIEEIDRYLGFISNVDVTISKRSSFLLAKSPYRTGNVIYYGASFISGVGGQEINTTSTNIYNREISAGIQIHPVHLSTTSSLNILIIDQPISFENFDYQKRKTACSSMIFIKNRQLTISSQTVQASLFFTVPERLKPQGSVNYLCSSYDTQSSSWIESGCTLPVWNSFFSRYECSCYQLTSFTLVWSPRNTSISFESQDIASLVTLSLSISCFLFVIIHAIIFRLWKPLNHVQIYELIPLISTASSTILFIFYMALTLTVITHSNEQFDTSKCFRSAQVLVFFVYFFLIMMLGVKSSVAYFNYLRFAILFPDPKPIPLWITLAISSILSIIWVSFAAGFGSNPELNIINVYGSKLCWFSRDALMYFVMIPVIIFLCITMITFILVGIKLIRHVRHGTNTDFRHLRLLRCIIILVLSSTSQGIGWLFGLFISLIVHDGSLVFTWFFIIFNGLEGFWSLLLYFTVCIPSVNQRPKTRQSSLSAVKPSMKHESESVPSRNQPRRYRLASAENKSRSELKDNNDQPYETKWIESNQIFSTLV